SNLVVILGAMQGLAHEPHRTRGRAMTSDRRSALRGAAIGAASSVALFGGVSVALASTQAGIEEAQTSTSSLTSSTEQAGVEAAQIAPRAGRTTSSAPA